MVSAQTALLHFFPVVDVVFNLFLFVATLTHSTVVVEMVIRFDLFTRLALLHAHSFVL